MSARGVILLQNGSARDSLIHPARCIGAAALLAFALLCGCAGGARSVPAAPRPAARDAVHGNRALAPLAATLPIVDVQSIGTANPASATSVAATFATAPATGDLLLAGLSYYYNGGASPITMPAGWTKLSEGTDGNTGLGVYYRYAQAGDGLTWTWVSRLNNYLALGLIEYANVAPGSVPAIASNITQPNTTTPTTPSLTPSVANSVPVGLFAINIGAIGRQTFTAGSGFTSVLSLIPPYHALGIEQGAATSTAVSAAATLLSSSQVSTALVMLAPPAAPTPTPTPAPGNLMNVQSVGTANPASATSVGATFATAPAPGDLLLAGLSYYYNGGASPITAPAGWTKLLEGTDGNTGLGVYYRYAQAGDGLTWTWVSRLNNYLALGLIEYANVAPGSVPAIASNITQPNTTTPTTPSLTPSVANSVPVGLFAINIGAIGRQTFTAGSGFTSVLSLIPPYHALGIEQGPATSTAVSATATLLSSSQVSTALVMLAPPVGATPTPAPTPVPNSQDYLTYHSDNMRDGWNQYETQLNVTTVKNMTLKTSLTVDGDVLAQPLYVSQIPVNGALHNVVVVATEGGTVYAFDADTFALLWSKHLGTPQSTATVGCSDIQPQYGITGTPVIVRSSPSSATIYVVDATEPTTGTLHTTLHAIDVGTASDSSVPIAASQTLSNGTAVQFIDLNQMNRAGLVWANGSIYVPFGSHCDNHEPATFGWLLRYSPSLGQIGVFITAEDVASNYLASIWQGGFAPAADSAGNIFAVTGNGAYDANTTGRNFGESVIKIAPDLSGVKSFFTPDDYQTLNSNDQDFGSGGVMLLPNNLAVAMGKASKLFLLSQSNLGGEATGNPGAIQFYQGSGNGVWGGPAYFGDSRGPWVYYQTNRDYLRAFQVSATGLTQTSAGTSLSGYGGSTPIVTSNGVVDGTGLVWAIQHTSTSGTLTLEAYDARSLGAPLFSHASGSWVNPNHNAFISPLVVNGKAYVAGSSTVTVFGL